MKTIIYLSVVLLALLPIYSVAQTKPDIWEKRIVFPASFRVVAEKPSIGAAIVKEIRSGDVSATYKDGVRGVSKVNSHYLDSIFMPQLIERNGSPVKEDFIADSIRQCCVEADLTYNVNNGKIDFKFRAIIITRRIVYEPITFMDEGLEMTRQNLFRISYSDFSKIADRYNSDFLPQFTNDFWQRYFDTDSIDLSGSFHKYASSTVSYFDIREYPNRGVAFRRKDSLLSELLINATKHRMNVWDIKEKPFERRLTKNDLNQILFPLIDTLNATETQKWAVRHHYKKGVHFFDFAEMTTYVVIYEWSFNCREGKANIKIVGVAPRLDMIDDDGSSRNHKLMFLLKYIDVRPYFNRISKYLPERSLEIQGWNCLTGDQYMRIFGK